MKIKIHHKGLSREEINFFKLLESDPFLEDFLPLARKESEILNKKGKQKLFENALILVQRYNLQELFWLSSFMNLILHNRITPATKTQHQPIELKGQGSSIQINIREQIKINELFTFIKNNKKQFYYKLSFLPVRPKAKTTNVSLKNTLVKEKTTKTHSQIADEYENKLPFEAVYSTVGTEVNRYKKKIHEITKRGRAREHILNTKI